MREYFACATISHELLNEIVSFCEDSSQQQFLGDILCTISSRFRKCHFRKSHRNALKYIIEQVSTLSYQNLISQGKCKYYSNLITTLFSTMTSFMHLPWNFEMSEESLS